MARIMIIAGGDWQVPLVKKAKEMGHYVLCTNLYADSPAFEIADEYEVADVLDKEKNLIIAKRWKPDAVLTDQSDIAVPTVAYICNQLNLRGIGEGMAKLFTNKYEMRCFEEKNGFLHPRFFLCTEYEDAMNAFDLYDINDAVIKPVDSQSSRGVYHINRFKDFRREYENARSFASKGTVIFEEYINGDEFTVDGFMIRGRYYTLAISRKKHYPDNWQIASDLLFSWKDDDYNYKELETINRNYITKTGLPFGLTHSEYKYYKGTFYLIEMAARGGGTLISSDIAPYMSGIDGTGELLRFLIGEESNITEDRENKTALLHFFDIPQGTVKSIRGIEQIQNIREVHKIQLEFREGETVRKPDNDRGRLGFVIIFGNNQNDVLRTLATVNEKLIIDVDSNEVANG